MMGAPTRHRGRSRYPTRSRNAGATGAAPATFNPLTDWTTDPLHGVWASDPLWTPPADGGAVSSWRNGGSLYTSGAYIGADGLVLPGTTTDYATTPDSAALSITGDIDVIGYCSLTDWTAASGADYLCGKGDGIAYDFTMWVVNTSGYLLFRWYDGAARSATSTAAPTVANGVATWIRATLDVDNGAGGCDVKFWQSADGSSWSQLGSTVTQAFTTSISDRATPLSVGKIGSLGAGGFRGTIGRVIIKNGIGGTTVFDADFSAATEGVSAFTESSSNAATVTVVSAQNPVQATGAAQPTYDAALAAYNDQAVVTFDGADDVLVANIADLTQPFWLVLVGHTSAVTTQGFVGVGVVSTYRRFGTIATAGGKWALALGGEIMGGGLDSNPHLLFAQANGASSLITVDGASVATGDAGTTGITHLSLGAGNANGSTFGGYLTGGIALALVFDTDPTALPEWATFKAWVTSFYGITVA